VRVVRQDACATVVADLSHENAPVTSHPPVLPRLRAARPTLVANGALARARSVCLCRRKRRRPSQANENAGRRVLKCPYTGGRQTAFAREYSAREGGA